MQLFNVYPLFDIQPVKGRGAYVFDEKGNEYLDFYGGHAVISIGHSHPHYVSMIENQLKALGFYSNSIQNPLQQELATKLGRLSGCDDYQLFLCNSGAEANENALKLASFHNGKHKIIAFQKAFHGRTSAAVNITDNEKIKAPINRTFEVEFHGWNNLETVQNSLKEEDVCAVIIEGIQGIGGVQVSEKGFLQQLEKACKQYGAVLILDEIQSGYGRSGHFFAFQWAGITPDLITVAKGMGNGFPIGWVLIHPKFEASYGLLGTTFGGNHLACSAGIAVLDVIGEENLIANAAKRGNDLIKELTYLSGVKTVRGMGLMIGVEFDFPVAKLRKQLLFEEKTFTGSSSDPNVLRLLPPLNIGEKETNLLLSGLRKLLSKNSNLQVT